jgi:hypothetical protein
MGARISKGSTGYRAGIVAGVMGLMVLAATQAPAMALGVSVKYNDLDIQTVAGAEKLRCVHRSVPWNCKGMRPRCAARMRQWRRP